MRFKKHFIFVLSLILKADVGDSKQGKFSCKNNVPRNAITGQDKLQRYCYKANRLMQLQICNRIHCDKYNWILLSAAMSAICFATILAMVRGATRYNES